MNAATNNPFRIFTLASILILFLADIGFTQSEPKKASRDTPSPKEADPVFDQETEKALRDLDFVTACENGDTVQVKALLAKGIDPNTRDALKNPALITAILKDQTEVVRLLLAARADPNLAATSVKIPPLIFAAEKGDLKIISLLLKAGADINFRIKSDDPKLQQGNGETVLIASIGPNASPGVIHALVRAGADVNAKADNGMTAIMKAAIQASPETVKALIDDKADVNAAGNPPNDITPVMAAVLASGKVPNRADVIKVLAKAGADVNAKTSDGTTANKIANAKPDPLILKALRDAGATD
jgi:ankyrin repeat protein